jgi:LysM repeat protein
MAVHLPISISTRRQGSADQGARIRTWVLQGIRLILLGALSFSLPPIILTFASYVYFHSSERILPRVHVGDLELGWMSLEEAERRIDERWNLRDDILVVDLSDPARHWEDQASSFSLSVDATATAQSAYLQGRTGQGLDSIRALLRVLHSGASVEYSVSIEASIAKRQLERWAEQAEIPAQDAGIQVEAGEVIVEPARDGSAVDVLASLAMVLEDPTAVRISHQMVPLVTFPIEAKRYATDEAAATLERMLASDIKILAYDPVTGEYFEWAPDENEIRGWYEIQPDGAKLKVVFIPGKIQAYLLGIKASLGTERSLDLDQALNSLMRALAGQEGEPLIIEYAPSSYVVQPGDTLVSISFKIGMPYWKLYEVNPELERAGLVVGKALVVPPKDDMLELPLIPDKRIVISILEQRMWVLENGETIREHIVSTGIPSSPTLPGIFQINSHEENAYASIWDLYMPHFLGIYDAVPGLTNGIHGLPLLSSGRRLWANVLGSPASYGCIILDLQAAEELFYWAEEGVVVEIRE